MQQHTRSYSKLLHCYSSMEFNLRGVERAELREPHRTMTFASLSCAPWPNFRISMRSMCIDVPESAPFVR